MGNYIPQTQSISLFRDPLFPGGVTIPIVGPVKPSYKIAAFFPTDASFGPMADLAKEWVSKTKNITLENDQTMSLMYLRVCVLLTSCTDTGDVGFESLLNSYVSFFRNPPS